ncbi:MAG: hypothetical protein ACREQ4_02860 [Candidatus Binataceae bacterium]
MPTQLRAARLFVIIAITFGLGMLSASDAYCGDPTPFVTLPASAPLPTDQQCASEIPATPETMSVNIPYNNDMPTSDELAMYYRYPTQPILRASQFDRVDGHYTGSTDMILRWAACKWGINENVVRAQAWTESKWRQGGPNPGDGGGDKRYNISQCVNGSFTALWNYQCPNCCRQSWGILQTKVFYDWGTWPMIKDSTAFNADYRYAEQRACMNGEFGRYFNTRNHLPNSYAADIGSGDLNRILWGCIGMHFSGSWYDPQARHYINEVKENMAMKPWPKAPILRTARARRR